MDGSNQLVVVALPTEVDPVRKFSSEKEPHLTILYLGENKFKPEELAHIMEYVEHAISKVHSFGLEVKSRGELGVNRADVLFFNENGSERLDLFRSHLLQDPLISAAYHSTDQFPDWNPHLTMGYPDSPAKKDEREYGGFSYVSFDRVALWTEEYSGPTYNLRSWGDHPREVSMSQIERGRSVMSGAFEIPTHMKDLTHYGVKGMRWGVKRDDPSGSSPGASTDAKAADAAQDKINSGGTRALSNQELQGVINRMNLERQYSTMTQEKSTMDRGNSGVKKALALGKTANDVKRFLDSPAGKAVKTGVTTAFAAGAAYATGGASAAATAGASVVVRRAADHYTNGPR